MLTALLALALLALVGFARALFQVLVAWIVGATPIQVILGIGPGVLRRVVKGVPVELRILPLGGHVQWGAAPYAVPPPGPWAARLALAAAGPLSTLALSAAVFFGLLVAFQARTVNGLPVATNQVELPTGKAVSAGLRPGDVVVALDGQAVEYYDEIARLVGLSGGRSLQLTVRRPPPGPADDPLIVGALDGRLVLGPKMDTAWTTVTLTVAPEPTASGYRLGMEPRLARLGTDRWFTAVHLAAVETGATLRRLLLPGSGPEGVEPSPDDFWGPLLHLLARVSLVAFAANLLLPAHDLHRLGLLLIEGATRRVLSPAAELVWVRVEVLLLLALAVAFVAWGVVG